MFNDFDIPSSELILLLHTDRLMSHQVLYFILLLFFLSQPLLTIQPFLARMLLLYEGGRV